MTERPGLYVMVFVAMVASCDSHTEARRAARAAEELKKLVQPAGGIVVEKSHEHKKH